MLTATYRNAKGNRTLKVYGRLNGDSITHYEAELFIEGISQGLEAITPAQVKMRYPVFVSAELTNEIKMAQDEYFASLEEWEAAK